VHHLGEGMPVLQLRSSVNSPDPRRVAVHVPKVSVVVTVSLCGGCDEQTAGDERRYYELLHSCFLLDLSFPGGSLFGPTDVILLVSHRGGRGGMGWGWGLVVKVLGSFIVVTLGRYPRCGGTMFSIGRSWEILCP
jgi:hypothetical protein